MQNFFYGWYLKCETEDKTLAIIPAVHQCGGKQTYSIQVITNEGSYFITFPEGTYYRQSGNILKPIRKNDKWSLVIGENIFCDRGMRLALNSEELKLEGKVWFRELTPLKYDIMGPFVWIPFMECRHSVYSMHHIVQGKLLVNGEKFELVEGVGYWEGDRGTSFPDEYLWTQCFFEGGSIMLSVAEIPFFGGTFTGVIGAVLYNGREYRFATYLGARVCWLGRGMVCIAQGNMMLEARLLEQNSSTCKQKSGLRAPNVGEMSRVIHENVACHAGYRFRKGREVCLDITSDKASFEYEYKK